MVELIIAGKLLLVILSIGYLMLKFVLTIMDRNQRKKP